MKRSCLLVALLLVWPCAWGLGQPDAPSPDLVAGIGAYNAGDFAFARQHLQAAAGRGEAEAMVNLGYMYARGHGVPRDPAFALDLYRRAATTGDGEAMNAVGYRYNFANPPDYAKAVEWYCKAVFAGNPRAMNNLAILFYNGTGIPQDRDEARALWRQASDRGSMNATANLASDQAFDASLTEAQRREGYAALRDAAISGSGFAQDVLRKTGDTEPFPPPSQGGLTMVLEPANPTPGTSRACQALVS